MPRRAQNGAPNRSPSLTLGALRLTGTGRRLRGEPIGPLHFRFRHGSTTYDCRMEEHGDKAVVTLSTPVGRLPGERIAPERRHDAERIVEEAQAKDIRIRVRHGGVVVFSGKHTPDAPLSHDGLVALLAQSVLPAERWIKLLRHVLDPPP
jgi:hypothetical protein